MKSHHSKNLRAAFNISVNLAFSLSWASGIVRSHVHCNNHAIQKGQAYCGQSNYCHAWEKFFQPQCGNEHTPVFSLYSWLNVRLPPIEFAAIKKWPSTLRQELQYLLSTSCSLSNQYVVSRLRRGGCHHFMTHGLNAVLQTLHLAWHFS